MKTLLFSLTTAAPEFRLPLEPGVYMVSGAVLLDSTPDPADTAPSAVQIGGGAFGFIPVMPLAYGQTGPQPAGGFMSPPAGVVTSYTDPVIQLASVGYAGTLSAQVMISWEKLH